MVSPRRPTAALLFLHFPLEESFRPSFGTSITILAVSSRGVIQTLAWHQYYYSCSFLSMSHSDPRLAPSIYFGISGGLPPDFSFISRTLLSLCLSALVNLFICIMSTFVISYVRTVLRVLSKYSLACPWLLSWPDFLHGEEHRDDSPGT